MPKVIVEIDPSLCITAANCTGIAPTLFRINGSGIAEIEGRPAHTMDADSTTMGLLEEAVVSCPTQAIRVTGAG